MLTDAEVKNSKPADQPYKLTDSGGLHLFVTPAGSRIWRVRYRFQHKEKLLTAGHYPAMGLAEARGVRDAAKVTLREGKDPAVVREQLASKAAAAAAEDTANTFQAVARAWYEQNAPHWRGRHADDVLHSLERDVFPSLGGVPIRQITVPMTLECLRAVEARNAKETARRIRQRMSAVFVHAIASGLAEADPAGVVKGAMAPLKKGRQPAIVDLDGVRKVLADAEAIPAHPSTRLALRLLALTAVRPGELRGADRNEFEGLDGPEPLWRIPAARMKMAREHLVPLSAAALNTVKVALSLIRRGRLVFPSSRHAHRPLSENAIGYLLNRGGYHGHHVPHGFRAAFSTIMNERHRPDRHVIDLMLAHAPKDRTEAAYNRAGHLVRRRELAEEWAGLLMEGRPDPVDLVKLPRRPTPTIAEG